VSVSASLDRPPPFVARVGAEFLGRARQFRTSVRDEDVAFDNAVRTIAAPLAARLHRHPRLRHEHIAIAAKLYQASVPATFRIGEVEIVRDRKAFAISETRLTSTWMKSSAWEKEYDEPGVAICRHVLAMHVGKLPVRWTAHSIVSLHALARFYERSGARDPARLLAELAVLATAEHSEREVSVATPSDGFWLGEVATMWGPHQKQSPVLAIRTWVDQNWRETS
jgi:hypothetical protein